MLNNEKVSKSIQKNRARRFCLFLPDSLRKEMVSVSKAYSKKKKLELSLTTIMLEGTRKEVSFRKSELC